MGEARRRREAARISKETVRSGGVTVEAVHKYNNTIVDPGPGEHLWTVVAAWRVNPDTFAAGEAHLDLENMLSIDGPGCFKCEQPHSESLARQRCTGETWWSPAVQG